MGMFMSFLGKGGSVPSTKLIEYMMGAIYNRFIEKDIKNFTDFHTAILEIFNNFNSAFPGKHFDVPPLKEIEECFSRWKSETKEPEKKTVFVNFITKNVSLSKLDNYTVITGVVTPPVAMAAKRAGENLPQLKVIKAIPDVIFVPSATVLALISAKLSQRLFHKKIAP